MLTRKIYNCYISNTLFQQSKLKRLTYSKKNTQKNLNFNVSLQQEQKNENLFIIIWSLVVYLIIIARDRSI